MVYLNRKNCIERINDSHYCEQADVFFSYYSSDFHQILLITVCTLVFLQFQPLTFIWSSSVCIGFIVIAMLFLCESKCLLAEWKDYSMELVFIYCSDTKKKKKRNQKILILPPQQLRMWHKLFSHFQGETQIF